MNSELRKGILVLINGYGIENKNSDEIITPQLMPNMAMLCKNYLYGSLENKEKSINTGYKILGNGSIFPPSYTNVDAEIENEFSGNVVFNDIIRDCSKERTKLHLFVVLNSIKVYEQLTQLIKLINKRGNFLVVIHFLFNSSVSEYDEILQYFNDLKYFLRDYPKFKYGIYSGVDYFIEQKNTIYRLLAEGSGEINPDYIRKFNLLKYTNVEPNQIKAWCHSEEARIRNDDVVFFLNYESDNFGSVIDLLNNPEGQLSPNRPKLEGVTYYSLYPLKSEVSKSLFPQYEPETCFTKSLERMNAKALYLTEADKIEDLNFFLNGWKNVKSPALDFSLSNIEENKLAGIARNPNYNLIIYDFEINDAKTVDELKMKLAKIDEILGLLYKVCIQEDYSMFVTSLYGMYKEYQIDHKTTFRVNLSGNVPIVIGDKYVTKKSYMVLFGNSYDFANTVFCIMKNDLGSITLLKKSLLKSILKI